jgi:hypothetical protein
MGTQRRDPRLAIRTIVVTTRAAVSRHVQQGRPDLAHRCVELGQELLAALGTDAPGNGSSEYLAAAGRELEELDPVSAGRR